MASHQLTPHELIRVMDAPDYGKPDFDHGIVTPPWLRTSCGMGDMIALSGAAVELAKIYGELKIPCLAHNLVSVRDLFINHPEIEIVEMQMYPEKTYTMEEISQPGINLVLGVELIDPRDSPVDCYAYLYRKLGINYDARWDSCPLTEASYKVGQCESPHEIYAFAHQDAERGMLFQLEKFSEETVKLNVTLPITPEPVSILSFAEIIVEAKEVHVIDSAFFWLAEHLPCKGKRFLHRYAKKQFLPVWSDFERREDWTIVL